jgi:precorrin-2 dehydrogenase/sirohydrochlorin ferrochelatase
VPFAFPLALEVTGRRCVVIGGGATAVAKVGALLDAAATVVVISAAPDAGLAELARRGEIQLIGRDYRPGDLAGALLVFATGDRSQNAAVFAEAEAAGVLCNAHQDSAHCHFASPTVTRRGDLVVAVSTGGRAPTLAGYVRDSLAEDLPDELGALIDLVAEIRAEGIAPADTAERGRLWRAALELDVLGLLGAGQWEAARRLLRGVLARDPAPGRAGGSRSSGRGPETPTSSLCGGRRRSTAPTSWSTTASSIPTSSPGAWPSTSARNRGVTPSPRRGSTPCWWSSPARAGAWCG